MSSTLAQTPLHAWHAAHGARLVDFAGWSMPVQYSSIVAEHVATRTACGLFDISHMGRLLFDGPGACEFLDSLVTRRVSDLKPGGIRYGLVTNEAGGILDDILVYRLTALGDKSPYLMVVNASNLAKILAWVEPRLAGKSNVAMHDVTTARAMIAVQGPQALSLLQPLVDQPLAPMKYYTGVECHVAGHSALVSRTGYTGEDGAEIIVDSGASEGIWQTLIAAGGTAAGLGCRDTLRLEAAMPLYGHELSEEVNPYQAGLGFAVNLEGRSFPGRDALARISTDETQPVRVGLVLSGKRVPRENFLIIAGGRSIGQTTSGTFSPTLEKPIAMGYVERQFAEPGTSVAVDIRGREEPAEIVKLPFYKRRQP
jgi:aminomethyltransferase